jgi:prepilin-type N-terminal cleavage/methylation domain-containing protein
MDRWSLRVRFPEHRRSSRDGRAGCGLTVLELIVALAILSILAGTAVLAHQAVRPGLDLSMAARQLATDLRAVRLRAVAANVTHRIAFTAGAGSYQVQQAKGTTYVNHGGPVALPAGIVVDGCTALGSAISFRPRGNAGSFGTVTMRNRRGEVRRVVVNITGRVRVE